MPVAYRCTQCGARCEKQGRCIECRRKTDKKQNAKPEKSFYWQKPWKELAREHKARYPYCQWLERDLTPCARMVKETDHVLPMEHGGPQYDARYLQNLCAEHHGLKSAREAKRGGSPDVFVVSGAPGSGKTSLVRALAQAGEVILDLDRIKAAISTEIYPGSIYNPSTLSIALAMRKAALQAIAPGLVRAWVIDMAPLEEQREKYREQFDAVTIVMQTPAIVCLDRISKADRDMRIEYESLVSQWWSKYSPSNYDLSLTPEVWKAKQDGLRLARPLLMG